MSDPVLPDGYAGPAAFLTAAGALIASIFRRGVSKHYVVNAVNPVENRVSMLEAHHADVTSRLDRIEDKLDRALER